MKKYQFFLFIFLISSCASRNPGTEIFENNYGIYVVSESSKLDLDSKNLAVDLKKTLCQNEKPIKKMVIYSTLYLPKAQSGLPIDKAGALKVSFIKSVREVVKEIFALGSNDESIYLTHNKIPGLHFDNPVEALKNGTIFRGSETVNAKSGPIMIYYKNKVFIGSSGNIITPLQYSKNGFSLDFPRSDYAVSIFELAENPQKEVIKAKDDIYYPLHASLLVEPLIMRKRMVLLLPSEIREKVTNISSKGKISYDEYLQSSWYDWNKYFKYATTVKEALSEDGKTINFESSLDLTLFCKYARPSNELVVQ